MNDLSNQIQVGVIGAGSFGTAISNIIAQNYPVSLYTRRQYVYDSVRATGFNKGQKLNDSVSITLDIDLLMNTSDILFIMVDSANFRSLLQSISQKIKPHHIIIHGTKGLDFDREHFSLDGFDPTKVKRMSEIILSESSAIRIGCLSGPNLAGELADGQPAATVIASRFDQVIKWGKACLRSETFRVYESYDLIGVELAGVLKNVLAIASGILHGLGLGENAKAMLITRGLTEMVKLGKALGAESDAFFGIAGIGDLIATCSSTKSRNFTVGFKLAKGASLDEILKEMSEVAEGVYTCKIAYLLSEYYKLETPIIKTLFQLIHQKRSLAESMQFLLTHHMDQDIEYHKL